MIDFWIDINYYNQPKLFLDWFTSGDYVTKRSGSRPRYNRFTLKLGVFKRTIWFELKLNKLPYTNYDEFVKYRKSRFTK